jgi:hypothetical protein
MANEYGVFNQGTVVLEYWCGAVTLEELLEHESEQSEDAIIQSASMVIADCRDAFFQLDQTGVATISQSTLSREGYSQKKVALIINPDTWDIANDYSEQFWGTSNDVLCFHGIEAASAWLDLDSTNLKKRFMKLKQVCLDN